MPNVWMRTTPYRLYRNSPDQRHDLSVVLNTSDIYEEDKMGRLFPDDESIMMPSQGLIEATAVLWAEPDVDLALGYFVVVKKPRVRGGKREATTAKLLSAANTGATTLSPSRTVGFASGDQISVKSVSTIQICKIKTVSETSITLYSDDALRDDFAAGSTVYACRFYRIIGRKTPHDTLAVYQAVVIKEILGRAGMLE